MQSVYRHRCLNEEQLAQYCYNELDTGENDYTLMRIRALVDAGFLEIHEYGDDQQCVFYLTHMGVQFIRDISSEPLYVMDSKGVHRKYEATAGMLKMTDNLLDHQTKLNALSLEIVRRCNLDPACYKDSIFSANFTYAQPDGVLELPEFDIFLEMDMGHERTSALRAKWEHYRTYFNSRDYYLHRDKRIIVLFATERVSKLAVRRTSVVKSLNQTIFELFSPMFDCYIGTNEEMEEIAERLITGKKGWFSRVGAYLQNKLGFAFSKPKQIVEACHEPYLYMRMLDGEGKPVVRDGRLQEFLFEDCSDRQMLGLKRAACYKQTQSLLSGKIGRDIPLLVLVSSEGEIYRDLSAVEARFVPNVYYVTAARLRNKPFYEALFQFDQLGNRYCFTDLSLKTQRYEKKQD